MRQLIATTLAMGTSAILIAFVLKIMGWQEAVILMLIGIIADMVALASYLSLRFSLWREHPRRKTAILVLVWGGFLVIVGSTFKLLHWPLSGQILLLGLIIEIVALITYFSTRPSRHLN